MRQIERCYGNQGWAEAVEKLIFIFQFNSFKLSESFKSVAQGFPEIFEEVYLGGGGGHNVPPPLVGIGLMRVCVCVIVVIWAESADVGLWVAVCFLAKISLHRPTCKTTFASLTQSQAISQSFRVFISFRSVRDTTFFHFSKLFLYKITVSFTMVIKRSPGGQASCRWRAVNFEIHL